MIANVNSRTAPGRSLRWILILGLGVIVTCAMNGTFAGAQSADEQTHQAVVTADGGDQADESDHGGNGDHGGHTDPFSFILLGLALIVVVAMFGRWAAGRLDQPAVLGELIIGVVIGNVGYALGEPFFVLVMHLGDASSLCTEVWRSGASVVDAAGQVFTESQLVEGGIGQRLVTIMTGSSGVQNVLMGTGLWMFSSLGVILLLFMVGLESSVAEMVRVGPRAMIVAIIGIVVPFGLGYFVSKWILPELSTPAHLFLAATLCATSVGITARVFKDLKALHIPEAKIILGAAVIDDVLGLIILAVVAGVVTTGEVSAFDIARITGMSVLFLGVIMVFGERITRTAARVIGVLDRDNNKLLFPLALAFALSWLANQIELATIVGAFAAGLVLSERHFDDEPGKTTMEELVAPLERIFAPVFFVLMGMQVNLATFFDGNTALIALALTVVAIIGKIVSGIPVGGGVGRLAIGIGMIPRGEVGLIFASIGRGLGVVDDAVFSALVAMVMVTTLITPPALKWALARQARRSAE